MKEVKEATDVQPSLSIAVTVKFVESLVLNRTVGGMLHRAFDCTALVTSLMVALRPCSSGD